MQTVTLKSLFQKGVFDNISMLRENSNNYPYVTLIKTGEKTKSTNLYFGRNSASLITDNFKIGDSVAKALSSADVVLTENAQGEKRFKLSLTTGNSKYESASALEDVFGARENQVDFDFNLFKESFTAQEVVNVPPTA